MLYLDDPQTINGVTLYRDYQNEKLFYYLPKDVKISGDEEKLHFTIYLDSAAQDSEKIKLDIRQFGGLLNLEVEMGPTLEELQAVESKLKEIEGGDVKLTPVMFEDGNVKLLMFGQDSSAQRDDEPMVLYIAGSAKPGLTGNYTAVFNTLMGGTEAQIMYDLLNNTPQTQMAVVYEMNFMGLIPAYNLEITVDFKATEKYWNNHVDLTADVEVGKVKVLAKADIDSIIRDLLNEGTIVISETDYTDGQRFSGDASSQIELVKKLMSTELFNPTAIPNDDNSILKSVVDNAKDAGKNDEKKDEKKSQNTDAKTSVKNASAQAAQTTSAPAAAPKSGTAAPAADAPATPPQTPAPESPGDASETSSGDSSVDAEDTDVLNTLEANGGNTTPPVDTSTLSAEERDNVTETGRPIVSDTTTPDTEKEETTSYSVDVNVGYTLRHRDISEQVKRTFTFNRRETKRCNFNNSGALSTTEKKFNPEKQVYMVKLGVEEFHETRLTFTPGFMFKEFGIPKAAIQWKFEDKDVWDSGLLDDDKSPIIRRTQLHNDEKYPNLIYKVQFPSSRTSEVYETPEINTKDRAILVSLDKLDNKQFLNVLPGNVKIDSPVLFKIQPNMPVFDEEGELTGTQPGKVVTGTLKKDTANVPVFMDKCSDFDILLEFPKENSSVGQKVTYRHQTGSHFIVNSPRTLKLSLILGEATFAGDIQAVLVTLTGENCPSSPIPLSKVAPSANLSLDYEVGGEASEGKIQASYQIFRSGGRLDPPVSTEYPADTEAVSLMIFEIEKKQEQ